MVAVLEFTDLAGNSVLDGTTVIFIRLETAMSYLGVYTIDYPVFDKKEMIFYNSDSLTDSEQ